MTDKVKSKPIHKIRAGALELAIWRNDGEKGPWFSVSATRSYKQGDEWKQSDSFGQDDSGPRIEDAAAGDGETAGPSPRSLT